MLDKSKLLNEMKEIIECTDEFIKNAKTGTMKEYQKGSLVAIKSLMSMIENGDYDIKED